MTTNTISITVKKSKLAENGDYNLTADRYRETVDYSNAKWPMVELGEVCEILDNLRKPITKSDRTSGEYPYYGATGILDYVQDYIFDEKLVLIGEDGAKWDKGDKTAFIATGKCWVNNHAHVLRPDRTKLLDELLVELINSMNLSKYITGITVPKLNQGALRSIKIPLPPLAVQEQIVAEIEQYQKVIDGAKQVVANWKPSFRIDPSWEMVELGGVVEIQRGGSPRPIDDYITKDEDGINWIKIGDVPEGDKYITKTKQKIRKEGLSKTRLVKDGDFILSNSMSFGRPYIVKIAGAIHDGWLLIRINNQAQITSDFLYQILGTEFLKEQYSRLATGGVVRNLNSEIVRGVKIPLPPLAIQEQIVAEIEAEQRVVNSNKELMEKMQKKVEAKIGEVWGEDI